MTIIKFIRPFCLYHRSQILQYNTSLQLSKRYKRHTSLTNSSEKAEVDTNVKPLGEKVKETTATASYLGIILLGVGVTGSLFYAVFRELFSSNSPNNIYSKAVEKCKDDPRIQDKLGVPILAFGNENSRRRRQHVTHLEYQREGRQYLRMKFFLKGSFHQGTAQLEMVKNESGTYEYRYLFVEVNDLLQTTIVLEDNRHKTTALDIAPSSTPSLDFDFSSNQPLNFKS